MPTVSIIVPVYNVATYVDECLASIAGQSFADIEAIVVDDGSTDGSGEICDAWAERDPRFVVIHQQNRGLSAARNAGLAVATGEYVQFVDSDDYVDARYTEAMLRYARGFGCACVVCGYASERNGAWETSLPSSHPMLADARDCVRMAMGGRRGDHFFLSCAVWNRIYRRSLFQEGGVAFPEGRVYEDMWVLVPTFSASRSVALVPDVLYFKHCREGSITRVTTVENVRDYVAACKAILAGVVERYPDLVPLANSLRARSYILAWLRLASAAPEEGDVAGQLRELRREAIARRRDLLLPRDRRYAAALLAMGVLPGVAARAYAGWRRLRGL
ncbi:MAG: glycosyltransferase [Coriobacteriales bacterium]|nr:glycosyltransferase [Coriobacteriales bacterium]